MGDAGRDWRDLEARARAACEESRNYRHLARLEAMLAERRAAEGNATGLADHAARAIGYGALFSRHTAYSLLADADRSVQLLPAHQWTRTYGSMRRDLLRFAGLETVSSDSRLVRDLQEIAATLHTRALEAAIIG